jgi:hypothetical protein
MSIKKVLGKVAGEVAGSVVPAVLGSKAGKKAADRSAEATVQAAQIAADVQRDAQAFVERQTAPGRAVGEQALFKLADLSGVARPVESQEGVRVDPTTGRPLDTFTNQPIPEPTKTASPVSIVPRFAPVAPAMSSKDLKERSKLERKLAQTPASNTKKRSKLESKLAQFAPAVAAAPIAAPSAAAQSLPSSAPAGTIPAGPSGSVALPQGLFESAPAAPAEDTRTPLTPGTVGGFEGSPGYQFRLQQGVDAIDSSAAARGLLRSGRRLKALTEFGQDIGAEEFGAEFNRLAAIAGIGETSSLLASQAALGTGANLSNIATNRGIALADQPIRRANVKRDLLTTIGGSVGELFRPAPIDPVTVVNLGSNAQGSGGLGGQAGRAAGRKRLSAFTPSSSSVT